MAYTPVKHFAAIKNLETTQKKTIKENAKLNRQTYADDWIICYDIKFHIYEPPHDKTKKMTVRPAKTQISLVIRTFHFVGFVVVRLIY